MGKVRFKFKKLALHYKTVDIEDVLKEVHIKNEDELNICRDIITDLELMASKYIQQNKCVSLPYVGAIRRNPRAIKINKSLYKLAKAKETPGFNFEKYTKELINNIKKEVKEEEVENTKILLIKGRNKERYKKYYKELGKAYADMYIASLFMMRGIEYNSEFDEIFKSLSD